MKLRRFRVTVVELEWLYTLQVMSVYILTLGIYHEKDLRHTTIHLPSRKVLLFSSDFNEA
jgi:hypothetical protein